MSPSNLEWVSMIIRSSGIGTLVQREAIVQRLKDANEELKQNSRPGQKLKQHTLGPIE